LSTHSSSEQHSKPFNRKAVKTFFAFGLLLPLRANATLDRELARRRLPRKRLKYSTFYELSRLPFCSLVAIPPLNHGVKRHLSEVRSYFFLDNGFDFNAWIPLASPSVL
jgi:hypothetical protein